MTSNLICQIVITDFERRQEREQVIGEWFAVVKKMAEEGFIEVTEFKT